MLRRKRFQYSMWLLCGAAFAAFALSISVGSASSGWTTFWSALFGHSQTLQGRIITELRLPRAVAAFAVGGLLALAGVLMQALLNNPLAEPYTLGTAGGAATAALLTSLAGLAPPWTMFAAFTGACASTFLVLVVGGGRRRGFSTYRMVLAGIAVASGWGALITLLLSLAPTASVRGMLFWLAGDLSDPGPYRIGIGILALALAVTWPFGRTLNLLSRGETSAASLGVSVTRVRLGAFLGASLLTATAVTIAGTIGFLGLVVPHALRLWLGADHRTLIPTSVLGGGTVLLLCDTLARTAMAPRQLPVGAITALLGVPVFVYLLSREHR